MSWLVDDVSEGVKYYPKLKIYKTEGIVKGGFDIINPNTKKVLETYELQISFPSDYPQSKLPIVKELGKKVPRTKDRHISKNGIFCLTTPLKEFLICRNGISFKKFLDEILLPFLATQLALSSGWLNEFPQGEYGHDHVGIYETYTEYFDTENIETIISGIKMAMARNQRNRLCYCGSGKKLKKCHIRQITLLSKMGKVQLQKDLDSLLYFKIQESKTCEVS